MIQVTPHMRVLVATAPVDFRRGIDGLACHCRKVLGENPLLGTVFVFCNRRRTGLRILVYDGQGFWLAYKRLSSGRLRWWPTSDAPTTSLRSHELVVLTSAGNPEATRAAEPWRPITPGPK
jgi:transposase